MATLFVAILATGILCVRAETTTALPPLPDFISECTLNDTSRYVIEDQSAGSLIFRPGFQKTILRNAVPCQWFIDGTAFGTHIVVNVSQLSGDCGFRGCIFLIDGDTLEDPLLASLPGSINRDAIVVVSSVPKFFIYIAAGCEGLRSLHATFRVMNCSRCSGNCSQSAAQSDVCDPFCPSACPSLPQSSGTCPDGSSNCACPTGSSDADCSGDNLPDVPRLFSILSQTGQARAGHSSVMFNETIWIFGGYNFSTAMDRFDGYNIDSGTWTVAYALSEVSPVSRYLHSAVLINDSMLIYGGLDATGDVLDDVWWFNFTTSRWERVYNDLVPPLAAHTATLVGQSDVYFFGGYKKDGTFSNSIYIWSAANGTFRLELPRNGEDPLAQMAAHSTVFFKPLNSLIVFGGVRSASAGVHDIFLYNVRDRIWTSITPQYGPNTLAPYSQLTFHRADVVGNYMVISGGYDVGHSRSCRHSSVYFYHLTCHVFLGRNVFEDKNISIPDVNRFGHSTALFDDHLYLYGGISDTLTHDVAVLNLPDFITSNGDHCVKDYSKRTTCQSDIFCVWCPKSSDSDSEEGLCVSSQTARIICGATLVNPACAGLCPSLSSCTACLSFKPDPHCTWCSQTAKCVTSSSNGRDDCTVKRAKEMVGWWTNKAVLRLDTTESCQQPQISSGLTVLLYQPNPDFSMPDEVVLVQSSMLTFHPIVRFPPNQDTGLLVVEMKGFIHPLGANPKSSWETQLRMNILASNSMAFEGVAQLWLSTDADPKNVEQVAESKSSNFPLRTEVTRHDGSLLFPAVDDKYFVRFVYQVTVVRSRLQADFDVRLYLTWNGNSIVPQALDTRNLEPFSTAGSGCPKYANCLLCLADASCGWCSGTGKCLARSVDGLVGALCQRADGSVMLLSVDFSQCTDCSVVNDPTTCGGESHCLWDVPARSCLRRSLVPAERAVSALPDCAKRLGCSGCVHSPGKCIWCHSTGQCLPRSALNIALAFGQCRFWENSNVAAPCTQCQEMKECDRCLSRPHCGWCSETAKDPRKGLCLEGSSDGSQDGNNSVCLAQDGPRNLTDEHSWAFSSCPDVDECTLGLADCHPNATCINTRGYFLCKCGEGYKGDGRLTCTKTCNQPCVNGRCSDELMPTIEPFTCNCDMGWTGPKCDIDCGCNFHSTCKNNVSQCDQCYGNTEGPFCERCVKGTFGNATQDAACLPCSCNGHADSTQPCDSATGKCNCEYPYQGINCEKCPPDFYGDPLNGGMCYSRCRSRTLIINATSGGLGNINDTGDMFCLWILVSGQTDYFGDKLPITLTIIPTLEAACPNNSLIIADGFPDFLTAPDMSTDLSSDDARLFDIWESGSRPNRPLGKICGPLDEPISVTAKSGIMAVMLAKTSRLERFNATYTVEEAESRQKRQLAVRDLSSRIGYSAGVAKGTLWIFGGLDPLQGVLDDLWYTGLDSFASTGWTRVALASGVVGPLPRYFQASCVVDDGFLIQGGITVAGDRTAVSSDIWLWNATSKSWREVIVRNAPKLAGHTMTTVKDTVYVIGGFGGTGSTFSDTVYTFRLSDSQWRYFPANGSRPPGMYGHSATYYPVRNAIFVFGGYRFDLDHSGISNVMSVLDLDRRRWIMMPSSRQDLLLVGSPRMFHAAHYVRGGRYMIIAGGRTPFELFDQSFLIYRFQCNGWLDDSDPNKTALYRPAFARFTNNSDSVMWLLSGYAYNQPYVQVTNIPLREPSDFCPRDASTRACLSVTGCGMCTTTSQNGSFCFDNSGLSLVKCGDPETDPGNIQQGMICDENLSVMRICREQLECRTCVAPWIGVGEDESRCQWCTNCGNGACIARYESCEASLSCSKSNTVIKEPGRCPDEFCHAADCQRCHDSRLSCFWTRSLQRTGELHLETRPNPVGWNCFTQELLSNNLPISTESSKTALTKSQCLASCSEFDTCTGCLAATGATGGFQQCVWSATNRECLDPAFVHLRCPLGNCGALLFGLSRDRCPRDPKTIAICRECLNTGQTGWCALDGSNGVGTCLTGGLSGPEVGSCVTSNNITKNGAGGLVGGDMANKKTKSLTVPVGYQEELNARHTWHFLICPPENECLNGHHTCDEKSEECQDTLLGYNCTCKTGYVSVPSTSPDQPDRCDPVCTQGCKNGRCVEPDICECQFGFVGLNCSTACQCNGHSQCPSEQELSTCTQCTNNTYGQHCENCQDGYVGDAKNGGLCQSCFSYCHGHAAVCLTAAQFGNITDATFLPDNPYQSLDFPQLKTAYDRDRSNVPRCFPCDGNTTGDQCEFCRPGYFRPPALSRPEENCRACECNGHDDLCNQALGTGCRCANNTATDPVCDGNDKKELSNGTPCWAVQCAQCKEYFVGKPTNGHQCYRQLSIGEDHCFDPDAQRGRCAFDQSYKPLRHQRTVFFAVQPKFLNVDIRIYVDVTYGGVDLWISDQDDNLVVTVDKKTGFHTVEIDKKRLLGSRGPDDVVDFQRARDIVTYVSAADPSRVVVIRDIRNRAIITIPYTEYELKKDKFYIVIHGIGSPSSDVTKGRILFRQDQPHIDLFVFFSVFFSCFFLFLAVCILLWKFKHVYGVRQTRQRVAIELQTMASRPFATTYLVFERKINLEAIPVFSMEPTTTAGAAADASTSSAARKAVASKAKKKKRNVVDPHHHETVTPRSSLGVDGLAIKVPKLMPMAMEFVQGGGAAVATFPMELPGGDDCPVRFCLASTLISAPQVYAHFNSKNE